MLDTTKIEMGVPDPSTDGTPPAWFPMAHKVLPAGRATEEAVAWIGSRREGLRSWAEFVKSTKFRLPTGPNMLVRRMKYNLDYFLSNYLCVFVVLLIYCVLTSFVLLVTLAAIGGLIYFIRKRTLQGPIKLGDKEIPPIVLYIGAVLLAIPLLHLADAGNVIYWVIGSSVFCILLHASFYGSEEIPGELFEVQTA